MLAPLPCGVMTPLGAFHDPGECIPGAGDSGLHGPAPGSRRPVLTTAEYSIYAWCWGVETAGWAGDVLLRLLILMQLSAHWVEAG